MIHDDDELAARSVGGDADAFGTILERHLHPAWRIALATTSSSSALDAAEAAVVDGLCDAVLATGRQPDPTRTLRTRIAASVHRAAADSDRGRRRTAPAGTDPVLAAFATLPAASRAALWLIEVEGGSADQVAPILGLDRSAAAALADRAAAALRDRLAADAAATASNPACAAALRKLPAQAAGRLTAADRERISEHVAGCGSCAAWLAATVAPRPALRHLVVPVPDGLAAAVAAHWAERPERDGLPWLRGWSERAVGAAAAAVLAIGLAGAALLGRDDDGRVSQLAAPAGSLGDEPVDDVPTEELPDPVLPTPMASAGTVIRTNAPVANSERTRSSDQVPGTSTSSTPTTSTTPTSAAPPASTPTTSAPPADSAPTAPPTSETDGSTPPATDGGTGTQVSAELPGVTIGLGDQTGIDLGGTEIGDAPEPSGEPTLDVELPGIETISLLG